MNVHESYSRASEQGTLTYSEAYLSVGNAVVGPGLDAVVVEVRHVAAVPAAGRSGSGATRVLGH